MVSEAVSEKRAEGNLLQWYKISSLIVFTLGSTKSTNLRLMGYIYLQMCAQYDIEKNVESYIAFKNSKYPHKNRDSRTFLISPRMCHARSSFLNQQLMRFQQTLSSHPPFIYPLRTLYCYIPGHFIHFHYLPSWPKHALRTETQLGEKQAETDTPGSIFLKYRPPCPSTILKVPMLTCWLTII